MSAIPFNAERFPTDEELRDELHEYLESHTDSPSEILLLAPSMFTGKDAILLNFEQQFRKLLARAIDVQDPSAYEALGRLISERALWSWEECR